MQWKKYKISPDSFRELNQVNRFLSWSHFLVRVLALFLPLLGIYYFGAGQFIITGVLLIAFGMQLKFMGWAGYGHELFHGKVFRSKNFNRFLFILFSALNWKNFGFFDVFHPIHHRNTLQTGGDLEGYPSRRRADISITNRLASCTFNLPRAAADIKILIFNATGKIVTEPAYMHPLTEMQIKKIVSGARVTSILLIITTIVLMNVFGITVGTCIIFSPYICTFFNDRLALLQHKDGVWDVDDFNLNTNTLILNPLISFLYANMNYHKEHHMYPSIPYYNLPKLRQEILQLHPIKSGLEKKAI